MEHEKNRPVNYARLTCYLTAALLAVVCIAVIAVVPRTARALAHAEETLSNVDALVETVDGLAKTADAALVAANEAAVSANKAADAANQLVADNADAVADAMRKINAVDFETLNKAINDLADIVEPLAKVSNFFNR